MAGAVFLAAVSGCSAGERGIAEPQVSANNPSREVTTSAPSSAAPISASIEPCDLISAEDLAHVGEFESEYSEDGSARSCYWQRSAVGGGDVFTFALSVRDTQSIETVKDNGGGLHADEVNQRPAVATEDPNLGDCTFAMKIDDSSRIDITVTGEDGCEIAKEIAGMVEPRLPELP